ncbi:hypothetical protein C8Q80DRAFT_222735 [Daedaleopsis nitida]|nr:hypothetical protein C8Q80DRAFT_222735 [Daedaleopsis nitida]
MPDKSYHRARGTSEDSIMDEQWDSLPVEDELALSTLSHSDVQLWILSRITQYERYVRVMRSAYNRHSPIHRLPPELLMQIFANVRPTSLRDLEFTRVCKTWRQLSINTPELWADILRLPALIPAVGDSKRQTSAMQTRFELILERSAPRSFVLPPFVFDEHMLWSLTPHTTRITSLELTIETGLRLAHMLCSMLADGMPLLEVLIVRHITLPFPCATVTPYPFTSDHMLPRLRVLQLPAGLVTATVYMSMPSLQSLTIGSCFNCTSACWKTLHFEDIFARLRTSGPTLTHLTLQTYFVKGDEFTDPLHPSKFIPLSSLQKLDFDPNYPGPISTLLQPLHIPDGTVLSMSVFTTPSRSSSNYHAGKPRSSYSVMKVCRRCASWGSPSLGTPPH